MSNVTPECEPDTVTVKVASTVPLLPSVTLTSLIVIVGPEVPVKVWPAFTAPGDWPAGALQVKSA